MSSWLCAAPRRVSSSAAASARICSLMRVISAVICSGVAAMIRPGSPQTFDSGQGFATMLFCVLHRVALEPYGDGSHMDCYIKDRGQMSAIRFQHSPAAARPLRLLPSGSGGG